MLIDSGDHAGTSQEIWYAFVESEDPFSAPEGTDQSLLWWEASRIPLKIAGISNPDRLIWFNCIKASYFDSLEWRDEKCRPGNEEQSRLRRIRLLSLKESELRVIPLLLSQSMRAYGVLLQQLGGHDWHVITTRETGGIPVWMFPEFGREAEGAMTSIIYERPCSADELKSLRRVFNLDFLPDVELGSDGRSSPLEPAPTQPYLPPTGKEKFVEEPPRPAAPTTRPDLLIFPDRGLEEL